MNNIQAKHQKKNILDHYIQTKTYLVIVNKFSFIVFD